MTARMHATRDDDPLVLEACGLRKSFTLHLRGGIRRDVLRDWTLRLRAGECVALVGASGTGKSTAMKCVYGTYAIDAGQLRLHGAGNATIDLGSAAEATWLRLRRRDMAYVSQFLRSLPRRSAIDVVASRIVEASDDQGLMPAEAWEARWASARLGASALLERLRLPSGLWNLPPATFSGGEQQRVNIARAWAVPSRLLLLDEPTSALDAANRDTVIDLILEAKANGAAILGIFHYEHVRDAVADRRVEC